LGLVRNAGSGWRRGVRYDREEDGEKGKEKRYDMTVLPII
jgi:hypothetical protein